ncbi:MAG: DrmB family protein [Phycisphaeraceae bacterium]
MPKNKGQVRRSQLITTYGVGSIVALEDESFMVAGLDRWDVEAPDLREPRLERRLRVSGFVLPPASEDGNDIPVVRFPKWAYCPECHLLQEHHRFTTIYDHKCNRCGVPVIPSRFVACCSKGHIEDFPYFNWVHAGQSSQSKTHQLRIESGGNTASLKNILITCSCGASRTMEGAFASNALRHLKKCSGKRPWLCNDDPTPCEESLRTLQRGASNVWFSHTQSAISIPPWSEVAWKVISPHWEFLKDIKDESLLTNMLNGASIAKRSQFSTQDLVEAIRYRQQLADQEINIEQDLKDEEYKALCKGSKEVSKDQEFVCVPAPPQGDIIQKWFDLVMQVKRLREVRVLCTFSRVNPPPGTIPLDAPPLYDDDQGWLPGVEVIGEGIFLRLNEERLKAWESKPGVQERAARINRKYEERCARMQVEPDRDITPRFLLIHTLAHALIAQWSLDAGYPASSLRERLYLSATMRGFMIYTATSDSAGSLGGIIAQAEPATLEDALTAAINTASWCSSDPLCIEADAGGVDSLNLAACHACVLLPEVSCEEMNLFLDRATLVGTPEDPDLGIFKELIE